MIGEDCIMADLDKAMVMRQILPPKCGREVRNFTGMCSYYRRFIVNFSALPKPLITMYWQTIYSLYRC